MLGRVEALGYNTQALQDRLRRAVTTGQFLCEYDNGLIIFKPNSMWRMIKNQTTGRRYSSARGGLRIVGKRIGLTNDVQIIKLEENFDESVPAERQEYQNFLRREAKGVTYFTHQMGSQHGRPLDILLDEDRSNRNYRPIY
ncbi:unnamed protein product [Rhizophagus irregularis]|nr:unnamed protein product [Rhizophagus irregularis]